MGYGQNPFVKMNGFNVKSIGSTIIGRKPIVGWYYKWDASGHQQGTFEYQKHLLTLHLIQCELQSISNKYCAQL